MSNEELISFIEENLQQIPDSTNFINGEGFVQQDLELVEKLKDLMLQHCGYKCSFSLLGRYLDDGGSPLFHFWSRLSNIDKLGREWGSNVLCSSSRCWSKYLFKSKFHSKTNQKK